MRVALILIVCHFYISAFSQNHLAKVHSNDPQLPLWAQKMYEENPNVNEVIALYKSYYSTVPFEKNIHTQYFKRWIGAIKSQVDENGNATSLNAQERESQQARIKSAQASVRGSDIWHYEGPQHHVDSDGTLTAGFRHANVYCHDRSSTNSNTLYCGTESGGCYKTTDGGLNWIHLSKDLLIGSVSAIRVHPSNDDYVIMSAADELWRTTDGGNTWEIIGQDAFQDLDISAWEITFNPSNPDIVYAATNLGFFRSIDGGDNWTEILTSRCETIAIKPNDHSVVYTIQFEPLLGYSRFYKSTDFGASFSLEDEGWFDSAMGDIAIEGGRLAVSEADPNRIYALLVGYQNAGSAVTTNGWVGTWVSYDAGQTWQLPHGLIGTPYTEEHPNLMNFTGDDGTYTQIHYNTTIAASQLDADKVLIGGLNLWISNDACASYEGVGGYIGGIAYFHVDQQEIRIYKTGQDSEEIWISNDGGISHSTNFMESHDNLNRGIRAVNLWGYDQGWNEDMMVGGRYHNGNMAYHENYPSGEFLALGGGEAPTGYVNYNDENETIHSDIGGYRLPETMDGIPQYFGVNLSPNESYWNNGSSRIMFDNAYFNIAWLGKDNSIYRSTNGGGSFALHHTFGSNTDDDVLWIEQSYLNHDYIYLHQAIGNSSAMWRSTDHGSTWQEMNLPQSLRNMNFTLGTSSEDELWVSYYNGSNGNKVYHSTNGGLTWENITTPALNFLEPWAMAHQYGTNGGVYLAMKNGLVFYRNNEMNDWESYSAGLPASSEPLRIVPFYKGNVIRLATWNLGVWEAPLFEPSALIADFAAEYGSYFCPGDLIHFTDHSVCSAHATYEWNFPGAEPEFSTDKNPTVTYVETGYFDVTMTITDNGASSTVTKQEYISDYVGESNSIAENFEGGGLPSDWRIVGNGNWNVAATASAFGVGTYSLRFDNYYYDAQGQRDDVWLGKAPYASAFSISFDAAYTPFSETWSDTLAVLYSLDCGTSWTEVYAVGGTQVSNQTFNSNYFTPEANQWLHHETSFSIPDAEEEQVIIAFQNRGYYGNALYVDNINLSVLGGVNASNAKPSIKIYPNPAKDFFILSANGLEGAKNLVKIYDMAGSLIWSESFNAAQRIERRITTDRFSKGTYIIEVISGESHIREKIVIH